MDWTDGHPEHWRLGVERLGYDKQPDVHVYSKYGRCMYCGHWNPDVPSEKRETTY